MINFHYKEYDKTLSNSEYLKEKKILQIELLKLQESVIKNNIWGGGVRPMVASYGKLMMWFFLMTDKLTFSAFLGAYGFQRFVHADAWLSLIHI